ncbi:MAG: nitroreductase family protein, partial [Candidatus Omnitrophota bacterium]
IDEKAIIMQLSDIMHKKSETLYAGFNIILKETAKIVRNAPVIIGILNSCELSERVKKFDDPYYYITKLSEIESVSASIQNMILMAHALGLGAAWLTSVLFCEEEIKEKMNICENLLAVIALGYPTVCTQLGYKKRKPLSDLMKGIA